MIVKILFLNPWFIKSKLIRLDWGSLCHRTRSVQLCRITVLVSAYVSSVSFGRGDICHLNAENQGSSQVSGSSRNSGMQIGISPCPVRPDMPPCLRAYALVAYAYLIYHFMRRYNSKGYLVSPLIFAQTRSFCSIDQPYMCICIYVSTYRIIKCILVRTKWRSWYTFVKIRHSYFKE